MNHFTRREVILRAGGAALGLGLSGFPFSGTSRAAATFPKRRVLFFSKSSGFEHSMIKRTNGQPSPAEVILAELGPKHHIDFTFSKDGSLFSAEYLAGFDAFLFYTTGDLTQPGKDKNPPMSQAGKDAFLDAIKGGKGFVGTHSATDTFHSNEPPDFDLQKNRGQRYRNFGDAADPYIKMIGAEFIIHGAQQPSKMRVVDSKFPGLEKYAADFELQEEWYSLKEFAKDMHVLLVQETDGMKGEPYQRPPYPATWARMHGKGRVFYTSMGHRDDVWASDRFRDILFGGIHWAVRNVDADVPPNLSQAAPKCTELPPESKSTPPNPKKAKAKEK